MYLLGSYLSNLPTIIALIGGLVLCVIGIKKGAKNAILFLIAFIMFILNALFTPIIYNFMPKLIMELGDDHFDLIFRLIGFGGSLFLSISWVLMLIGLWRTFQQK